MDCYTRWPEAFTVPNITAEMVSRVLLSGWISRFGGTQNHHDQPRKQVQVAGLPHPGEGVWYTPLQDEPHHPATNSFTDRLHCTLKAAIICYANEQWTEALMLVLLGIHTAYKEDLQSSVAELVYGEPLWFPGKLLAAAAPQVEPTVFI